jgi:membrane-bound lytic murein transglycosylase D
VNAHIKQLQPVPQLSLGHQVVSVGRQARARNQAPHAPQATRLKAKDNEVSMCGEHAVDLAQHGMRPIAVIKNVRQQDTINRIVLDRQAVEMSDSRGSAVAGSLIDQRRALSTGVGQKGVEFTPQTQLQALLTENAIQRLFDEAAFLLHQRIAQWRGQPLAYGFGIVCRWLQKRSCVSICATGTCAVPIGRYDSPMSLVKSQLLQRIRVVGATGVTFFVVSGVFANPLEQQDVPSAALQEPPSLTLISPLDGLWDQLETVEPASDDLLTRLRYGFELEKEQNSRIEAEMKWFVSHPDYLDRVFTRAQRYLPHITDELQRRGLPLELALLPIVESAYDPFAYSHGRAAGLWQMIPGTATRFGLKQNWWYDGRRDVVESTRAALDYLEYLYEFNDGNWLNAIASYNSGEGNVRKAVRRNRAANKPVDFWNLRLSKETSAYVPRLLALVEIVRDPAQFNVTLPRIADEAQFVVADIGSQIDLALAAELAGVDVDTMYTFNPGYNRWSTDPQGPHTLVLPVDVADQFVAALAEVPAKERVRWQRHKVKNGEAISQIANRYNTTVAAIRSANNLRGNTIRAGHYLMIPVATKPLSAYSKSADARLAKTQNRQRAENKVEHVVRSGESFWTISQKYNVTTRELSAWNGMAPRDTLPVGRTLVVWTDGSVAETPRMSPTEALGNTTRKLRYTVRNGDSLYVIARKFRVGIDQIARWNNIDKNKILRPGQTLTMYVDVTRQSS